ncbi:MAG: type II secretion system secretin GspD [Candidatus Competibacteraceae bacterium]|nr:type II secretion system secretin GspD [Candidatus Competibacteraceae bacterium]
MTLNLKDADINALVASIAEITGKNFIVDPRVKGKVTVVSGRALDEKEIYDIFLSILAVHGFAAIPGDNVIKIVPSAGAKQEQVPVVGLESAGPGASQIVTRVIQVKNVAAAQLVPILRPLIPPEGHLAAYAPTNVLIVADLAGNVQRIADIIAQIDRASNEETELVALQNAAAAEVVRLLTALEQSSAASDPAGASKMPRLIADERTNSILISADQANRERLRQVIANLDTPLQSTGNTQVVYLSYAKATELLATLQGVSQQLQQGGSEPVDSVSRAASAIDIRADEATNALIISAEPDAMQSLKEVIAQLDIRRAQVLVEAVIAEISSDKLAELGIQWLIDGSGDGSVVGYTNFDSASFNGLSVSELASAIVNETVPSSLGSGLNLALGSTSSSVRFAALISALASDANTNVLSTPTIVTLDNEEAEIIIGQNVPFVTGTFTTSVDGGDGVGNPFQTIERQDVGLTLRVKPQINEGNAIQLDINQEVSSVVPTATSLAQGPTTNKRSLKTNVLVEDGQVLVLGGLIDDQFDETIQKVPGLGDIPVIGGLFRYRQASKTKRNLMIFLHPVILRNALDGDERSADKYSYIRDQQHRERQQGIALLPEVQTPLLKTPEQVQQDRSVLPLSTTTPEPAPAVVPEPPAATPPAPSGFSRK